MSDEQKRRLARAWLALAGWRNGMMDLIGQAFDSNSCADDWMAAARNSDCGLPDVNAPANWGHWLAWTADTFGDVSLRRSGTWWSAETVAEMTGEHETPAAALLELCCRYLGDDAHEAAREWWKHEREGAQE